MEGGSGPLSSTLVSGVMDDGTTNCRISSGTERLPVQTFWDSDSDLLSRWRKGIRSALSCKVDSSDADDIEDAFKAAEI